MKWIRNETRKGSGNYLTAILLSIAGGFLDAYTYYERGGVFANAQTGNMIKMGLKIGEGDYAEVPRFLISVMAFSFGVVLSMWIEHECKKYKIHLIHRLILLIEMSLLIVVGFIPENTNANTVACTFVSFVCAMQMEGFKQFGGYTIATTVGTGNLRQFVEHLFVIIANKDKLRVGTALSYFLILLSFTGGVIAGVKVCGMMGITAVWVPSCIYAALIILLTIHYHGYR